MRAASERGGRSGARGGGPVFTMDDLDVLHCAVCCNPLRPPIFQCSSMRHIICSYCHDKLPGKCCFCSDRTVYSRCHRLEDVVESLKVACPNGCTARIKYHQKEDREEDCPQAPCFCPIADCSFSGPTARLLDHFSCKHKLQSTKVRYNKGFGMLISVNINGDLPADPTILVGEDGHLFIVYMKTESLGGGIVVGCVQPHITTGSKFKCNLSLSSAETGYSLAMEFQMRNTNRYDGFPDDCFLFLVPKAMLPGAGTSAIVQVGMELTPQ